MKVLLDFYLLLLLFSFALLWQCFSNGPFLHSIVSRQEFNDALARNGFSPPPSQAQYSGFINSLRVAQIGNNKMEAAMYLAQLIHESGGLKKKEEDMQIYEKTRGEVRNEIIRADEVAAGQARQAPAAA